ncbi:MAG: response regulator [Pseudomonadota bacterium]
MSDEFDQETFVEHLKTTALSRHRQLRTRLTIGGVGGLILYVAVSPSVSAAYCALVLISQVIDLFLWRSARRANPETPVRKSIRDAALGTFIASIAFTALAPLLWFYGEEAYRPICVLWASGALLHATMHMYHERTTFFAAIIPHTVYLYGMPAHTIIFEQGVARTAAILTILTVTLYIGHLASVLKATQFLTAQFRASEKRARDGQAAAEAANVAKSAFLANMSHEIRTPMNGVLGMAELLRRTELTNKQAQFTDTIYSSGSALLKIINDILDFSKIESGKLELDPVRFNLEEAVEDVGDLLGVTARAKGLELMIRIRPGTPNNLIGDVGRLRQILTNIVGNAVKFTHEGRVLIDVSGAVSDGEAAIKVDVTDTGIGIAEDKQGLVFEDFAQAETSTTRSFGGTGLGLSICRRLALAMGGDITLQSTIGVGSVFSISLKMPLGESTGLENNNAEHAVPDGGDDLSVAGKSVLIVDDVEINREIFGERLVALGAVTRTVASGKEAVEACRAATAEGRGFDLAVIDLKMPDVDGLELVRRLRRDYDANALKVVIVSSVDRDELSKSLRALAVEEFLTKPVRTCHLSQAVARALAPHKLVDVSKDQKDADLKKDRETTAASSNVSTSRARILVAEDNVVNRLVLENMIDGAAYHVDFAENGRIAYNKAREQQYDIILMDMSMPEMDGMEATKAIRAHELVTKTPYTPIIAITAHAMTGDRERFESDGVDDYLPKPVTQSEVDAAIQRWVRKDAA